MQSDDELKDFPRLKQLQGNNPFAAPEGYFDTLSISITDKISAQSNQKPVVLFKLKPILVAGLALAIITSALVFNHLQVKNNTAFNNPNDKLEITCDELISSGYYEELDENLLAEAIIQEQKTNSVEAEIENYLIDNTDESTLINSF
jgi:hypothetical protein